MSSTFLTKEQLKHNVPSIFNEQRYHERSEKYQILTTAQCLEGLFDMGFGVTKAMEVKSRAPKRMGFNKHMIRLRHRSQEIIGDYFPEIVLVNSHDGSSCYEIKAGIFRLVCSNGLVIGDEICSRKVRHQSDAIEQVAKATGEIIEIFPSIIDNVHRMKQTRLSLPQQIGFANVAKSIRWSDPQVVVSPFDMLKNVRSEDEAGSLWTTYNIIQEKLLKGGLVTEHSCTLVERTAKPIRSIDESNRINTCLWDLSNKMLSICK